MYIQYKDGLKQTLCGPFPLLRNRRTVNHSLSGTAAEAANCALDPLPLSKEKGTGVVSMGLAHWGAAEAWLVIRGAEPWQSILTKHCKPNPQGHGRDGGLSHFYTKQGSDSTFGRIKLRIPVEDLWLGLNAAGHKPPKILLCYFSRAQWGCWRFSASCLRLLWHDASQSYMVACFLPRAESLFHLCGMKQCYIFFPKMQGAKYSKGGMDRIEIRILLMT